MDNNQEYKFDEEVIDEFVDEEVDEKFEELVNESKPKGGKLATLKKIGAGIKNVSESFGNALDKTGVNAEKIGNAAEKLSKATSKVGKSISETAKKVASTVKNADYHEIANTVKEGSSKAKNAVVSGTSTAISAISSKSKELAEKSKTVITEEQMQDILSTCYSKSINGIPGVSKSVDELANNYLSKSKSPEHAAKALINAQLLKCATSGFVTGLGGLITLPVAVPANVASVLYVQMRMIASVAKIGGYDPSDDQVQTLVYACLTGQAVGDVLKSAGIKIGNKLAISSVQKISGKALTRINQAVGFRLLTKFGETGVINLGKAVPVVGGVVGGGFDYATTRVIAKNAYRAFILNDLF